MNSKVQSADIAKYSYAWYYMKLREEQEQRERGNG